MQTGQNAQSALKLYDFSVQSKIKSKSLASRHFGTPILSSRTLSEQVPDAYDKLPLCFDHDIYS